MDGAYSEFGGQSEYDSVVPGGSVNDGALSDGESSRSDSWLTAALAAGVAVGGCYRRRPGTTLFRHPLLYVSVCLCVFMCCSS